MDAATAVRELVERSGLTKSELSKRSGVSRSLLDEYLKGSRQPSVEQLRRLGEAAGYRLDLTWRAELPRWVRPSDSMKARPLTLEERAAVLERVCALGMSLPHRERGDLEFGPFRALVTT